jgi:hydroxymethylpyrimidine/phosphomethylpyrimidine kinase
MDITGVHKIPARFITQQVETVIDDVFPRAVKIGMLYTKAAVKEAARLVKRHGLKNVVLDPVLSASTGKRLLEPEAATFLKERLLPLARVVTPNLFEAGVLSGKKVEGLDDMTSAAKAIKAAGPDVVITGGHLMGKCTDLLYDGDDFHRFEGSRIETDHSHGSGCVFSTALATFLAEGKDVVKATEMARDFTRYAILRGYPCGKGHGPVRPGYLLSQTELAEDAV